MRDTSAIFISRLPGPPGQQDNRRLDIVTSDIDGVFEGRPLFLDVTCVSPVSGQGSPKHASDNHDGAVLAFKNNETRRNDYPDIHNAPRAALLSLSVEI